MNKYEELVYSLIYNCNRELTTEEKKILNQASAIYNTYNNLTEELGCPLEVRCNVVCDSYIYDENGIQYKVVYVYKEHFDCEDPFDNDMGYTKMCAFDWKDYKKTWWLKEDRSE